MVGTDLSQTASRAVGWANDFAERFGAELHLVQVIVPDQSVGHRVRRGRAHTGGGGRGGPPRRKPSGWPATRGRAHVVVDEDPAMAIVGAADDARIDVLVVGNAGMAGRKEFLLGNVPNRISHNARCTVIIVNTTDGVTTAMPGGARRARLLRAGAPIPETQPHLIARGSKIATVFAKHGLKRAVRPPRRGGHGRAGAAAPSGCARRSRSSVRRSASSARSCRRARTCSRRSSSPSSRSSKTTCRRCPRNRSSS